MTEVIEIPLLNFAGYREKVVREHHIRRVACLGLKTTICGIEVKPLCAAQINLLTLAQSPFLCGFTVSQLIGCKEMNFEDGRPGLFDDIMLFLWIVSPMYEAGSLASQPVLWYMPMLTRPKPTARDLFNAEFEQIFKTSSAVVITEILEYVEDAFIVAGLPEPPKHWRDQNKLN